MRNRNIIYLALALPIATLAQSGKPLPERLSDVLVFAGEAHYPEELAARGVQGRTVLATEILTDGTFGVSIVAESSGSPELDVAAPLILSNLKGKPQSAPVRLLVPILFYKDSIKNLPRKTCAEFNIDYAYFTATFPGNPASQMRAFELVTGIGIASGLITAATISKIGTAIDKTVTSCSKLPSNLFVQEFATSFES